MSDNKANYIEDANRTKSTSYYPAMVGYGDFVRSLDAAIGALNYLDKIKKALFYGKPLFPGLKVVGETCETLAIEHLAINDMKAVDILHGIIGKATEGCELLEALERSIVTGTALDFVNVAEEIGDGQWYDAILAKAIGVTFEEVQATNIAKLRKRYPEKYADAEALTRDLAAEREVLSADNTASAIDEYAVDIEDDEKGFAYRLRHIATGRVSGWAGYSQTAMLDDVAAATDYYTGKGADIQPMHAVELLRLIAVIEVPSEAVDYNLCDGVED